MCKTVSVEGPFCYVDIPSSCKDLRNGTNNVGTQISYEACSNNTGTKIKSFYWTFEIAQKIVILIWLKLLIIEMLTCIRYQ